MTQKYELLEKENLRAEKNILPENEEAYTNMIVYIRGSNLSDYEQELVRADLLEMILAGQERGDGINKIIGTNYKEVCDEIINSFPPQKISDKLFDWVRVFLSCISVLGVIMLIQQSVGKGKFHLLNTLFTVTFGDILMIFCIIVIAVIAVQLICKNAFEKEKNTNKILEIVKYGIAGGLIMGLFLVCKLVFTQVIFTCSIIWAIIFVICVIALNKLLETHC